jgi:hypothetical protein
MRPLAGLGALTAIAGSGGVAVAAEGRYCAGGMELPSDCSLMDWQMCLDQARPQGGNCYANPNYRATAPTASKSNSDKRKRRAR